MMAMNSAAFAGKPTCTNAPTDIAIIGDEKTCLIDNKLYSKSILLDVWVDGLYEIMKRALQDAPWQPKYNTEHIEYDNLEAIKGARKRG